MKPRPIPLYCWALWMSILGLTLIVFYGIFTPVWMSIRLLAWLSDRGRARRAASEPDAIR
jgi:hypothetical protein